MHLFIAIAFIVLGIVILSRKADFLVAGYREALDKTNIKFDFRKVRYIVSTMLIFIGVFFIADYFDIIKKIPAYIIYIIIIAIIVLIVGIILKRKKED